MSSTAHDGPVTAAADARAAFEAERVRLAALRGQGGDGPTVCAALTAATDVYVRALHRAARVDAGADPDSPPGYALLAIGGYGRGELAPYSDIDLLFLSLKREADGAVVESMLHALWDTRMQVGQGVRRVAECKSLAASDVHAATAHLTARTVDGDPEGVHRLRSAIWSGLGPRRTHEVLDQLRTGMERRHERYGRSVYLLEPDLKNGPGGLRDLSTALWAAMIRHRIGGWADLLPRGISSPQEVKALARARAVLLNVRNTLHFVAGHAGDRMTFEYQEAIARRLGFGEATGDIERFMAAWYAEASTITSRARLILERAIDAGAPRRRSSVRAVAPGFARFNGQLTVEDAQTFEQAPTRIMELFALACRHGLPIYRHALERVIEAVHALAQDREAAAAWRADRRVAAWLLEVLVAAEDPHDALGDLHETGVLGLALPEFGAVTHRTHHDLYHVYTVDIHTLHALRKLKALHRGDLADSEPLLTEAMRRIDEPASLYVGLLMHDAGKALGRGHAIKGARLVPAVARRLGLSPAQARDAEWLVRDHLVMAHISQRRDLEDDALIRQVARQIGSRERLAKLFVLTWADALTTGPQAYTDWKAALLAELYGRADDRLRRGLDLYDDPKRRVQRMRRSLTLWLMEQERFDAIADVNGAVDRFFASLPTPYFRRTRLRTVALHFELLRTLKSSPPVALEVVERPSRGYGVVHVATRDRPGLLSLVTGVLAAHGLNILGAELHSTSDGIAIDLFRVQNSAGQVPSGDAERWDAVRTDLAAVLRGDQAVDVLLAPRTDRDRQRRGRGPENDRPTRATIDQEASELHTIIDVETRDRPGLLHLIARTLAEHGVSVTLARVTTESDLAHDTFYVTDAEGRKLMDAEAGVVAAALRQVLDAA